jgi:basic membrane protein A
LRPTSRIAVALTATALTLTACGSDDATTTEETDAPASTPDTSVEETQAAAEADFMVGMAYDVGGRGDQSFNDAAAAGMDQASQELGFEVQEAAAQTGEAEAQREERLRTLADAGFNVIVAVGFAYGPSLATVAPEYPDITFAIVDVAAADAGGDNITNLVFAEEQGSFLVGAAAALKTESDHIGFIGGVEVPLIQKFEAGYVAGAQAVNPDITVDVSYLTQPPDFSGFGDPAKGRTAADGMFQAGADIVYAAAGGSGGGVFEGAAAAGARAIGVDSDQYNLVSDELKPVVMTSMLKKVDVAVYDFLTGFAAGDFESGDVVFDLESDGVGYATSGGFIDDITGDLEDFKAQIIAGDITVPTTP